MEESTTNEKCEIPQLNKLNKNNDCEIIEIKNKQKNKEKKWIQYSISKENIKNNDKEECLKYLKNYQNERCN